MKIKFFILLLILLSSVIFFFGGSCDSIGGKCENNEPPVLIENQVFSIEEHCLVGTDVGSVSAYDADGDELQYSITEGNESGLFAIDPQSGLITVDYPPDFETQSSCILTVEVSDECAADNSTVTVDISNIQGASITGAVFVDGNTDGDRDTGEGGICDVTVELYRDPGNPLLVESTTTNALGEYAFEVQDFGTYIVKEIDPGCHLSTNAVAGAGAVRYDYNTLHVDITMDDIINEHNFSENLFGDVGSLQVIIISGKVWEDIDEPGMPGVVVQLNNGMAQTTSSNGLFTLHALYKKEITIRAFYPSTYEECTDVYGNDNICQGYNYDIADEH
jgi:hypothetical protein